MSTEISPQIRLVAIVGLVLAVLAGGAMFVMTRSAAAEGSEPIPPPFAQQVLAPVSKAQAAGAKAKARQEEVDAAAAGKPKAAKPAPKPAAAKPKTPPPTAAPNGLPLSVAAALARNEVVVVSLYTPGADIDAVALEEARAGAKAAEVGFVAVNVLDEAQGEALAKLLGVEQPPVVLVYRSPDTLVYKFQGFADLDTVAQAATSARA